MVYFREITEHYRIEKTLRARANGGVFRSTDPVTGTPVALKLIPLDDAPPERAQAFVRGMSALQGLRHPSLPALYDFGFTPDGHAFLVQEHVDGRGAEALQGGAPAQILPLLAEVLDGLERMAQEGLAHLNLCPENLLVVTGPAPGRIKMVGLGSALLRPPGGRPEGEAAGYAAPEMGRDPESGPRPEAWRADLLSLALIACRLLEARLDTGGGDPRSPRVSLPLGVSFELEDDQALQQVLSRCLRFDPAERPGFAEVRQALESALASDSGARPLPQARLFLTTEPESAPWPWIPPPATPPPVSPPREPGDDTNPYFPPEAAPVRTETLAAPLATEPVSEEEAERAGREDSLGAPASSPALTVLRDLAGETPALPGTPTLPSIPAISPRADPLAPMGGIPQPPPRRSVLLVGAAGAAALLLCASAFFWLRWRSAAPPLTPPAPPPAARAAAPPPPAAPPAAAPAALPPPLPDKLAAARDAFADGKDETARQALAAITREEEAAFTPEACTVYRVLGASLDAASREQRTTDFRAALRAGDLPQLAAALRALSPAERAALQAEPGPRRELTLARRAADLYQRYDRAAQGSDPAELLRAAGAVAAAFPRFREAADRREKTAAALEAEAETLSQTGAPEAALERLETLRRGWPERPGLAERIARASADRSADQGAAAVLSAAAAAEARKRPDEGLALLQGAKPTPRYEARFRDTRQRLEGQLAQLDRNPPVVQLAGVKPDALEFEKGATVRIPLQITDDFQVRSVVVRVRPEGGSWTELPCPKGVSDCAVEVPPSLHQNRTIELYAVATDLSGHQGQLGSAEKPLAIRRKHWYDRLRGKAE